MGLSACSEGRVAEFQSRGKIPPWSRVESYLHHFVFHERVYNELKTMSQITSSADIMITSKKGKKNDISNQKGLSDLKASKSHVFLG